jgi:bla regulator protein blaR1
MTDTLGLTLIHFLWQGVVVALLLAAANVILRDAKASTRYIAACAAMTLMAVAAMVTFWFLTDLPARRLAAATSAGQLQAIVTATPSVEAPISVPDSEAPWLALVVAGWAVGVLFLSIRAAGGLLVTRRLRQRAVVVASTAWQRRLERLASQLELARFVRLCESSLTQVTMTIGWLRPVILIPAGALLQLPPEHIEALLAHELAHIRRLDYLVNLLQTAVETLFFYHPAVWWVGQRIREERENCCDDLAVATLGDPVAYAKALTELGEFAMCPSQLAVAATGGSLMSRVKRLVLVDRKPGRAWLGGILATAAILAAWACAQAIIKAAPQEAKSKEAAAIAVPAAASAQQESKPMPRPTAKPRPPVNAAPQANSSSPIPTDEKASQQTQARPGGSYIDAITAAGYTNLSVDQLIAFKTMGVTPEYVRGLQAEGLHASANQIVAMRTMGVTPEYVRELRGAGYPDLTINQLIACRTQGVNPETVRELNSLGFGKLPVQKLISAQTLGLDTDFVRALKEAFPNLSFNQAIAARTQGLTPDYVRDLRGAGFPNLTFNEALSARVQGVTPEFVRQVSQHGFKNLTIQKIIELRSLGIFTEQ